MPIERHGVAPGASTGASPPFSKAVRAGDFVFVSGQVPFGPDGLVAPGGIVPQTHQVVQNIQAILGELGLDLSHVVKATAWIDDTRDFGAFNKVYASYFGENLPARSCVRADLVIDAKVEVEVIAYAPK